MLQDQAVIQTNAEDKAIWTATIDNGAGWRNKFTLLKIAPALIWADPAERPDSYSGSLVVEEGNASPEKPETTCEIPNDPIEQRQAPEAKMTLRQPAPTIAKPSNDIQAIAKPSTDDQEETDDLYALLGNINSPPEELDTSHDSPAVSPTNTRGEENLQQPLGTKEPIDCAPEAIEDVFMPSRSTDLGQGFVGWMKSGITARRLFINDTKALVHTVDGTAMLVTPWRDQHGGPVDGMHQSLGVVDEQATGRDARFHPANESLSQISASARHKYIFNCFRSAICWLLGP